VAADRSDIGYLLALASRRWNDILEQRFAEAGFGEIRASYGALLIPLFEEDGLRMSEVAQRARLSKQTLTTMARLLERDNLIARRPDPHDARATRLYLTERARAFEPIAKSVLDELETEVTQTLGKQTTARLKQALGVIVDLRRSAPALLAR
jgi:DNA-binding MarR family transcriptional regulator